MSAPFWKRCAQDTNRFGPSVKWWICFCRREIRKAQSGSKNCGIISDKATVFLYCALTTWEIFTVSNVGDTSKKFAISTHGWTREKTANSAFTPVCSKVSVAVRRLSLIMVRSSPTAQITYGCRLFGNGLIAKHRHSIRSSWLSKRTAVRRKADRGILAEVATVRRRYKAFVTSSGSLLPRRPVKPCRNVGLALYARGT